MHVEDRKLLLETDEGPLQSDAYIDALLNGHARLPIPMPAGGAPERNVRSVIRLLETGLPRFHPSFLFEERLAGQLRAAADEMAPPEPQVVVVDRRLLMGGALASGVSITAAAMLAWRRRQG
jgi:hypothetical protein